jgi:pimeloyl-ACP methyl ester carboxylesterase
VARGEEKSIAIAGAGGLALEGVFAPGEDAAAPGAVIAPPHPLYGGSMDSPVLEEVAWALRRAGCASLRFNWRGVGASGGATSGEARDADADYAAALEHLEETVSGPLIGAGYSFGAATAVRVAAPHSRVRRRARVRQAPTPAPGHRRRGSLLRSRPRRDRPQRFRLARRLTNAAHAASSAGACGPVALRGALPGMRGAIGEECRAHRAEESGGPSIWSAAR